MLKEFQEFISKGNVMDLAVGVIIGGAFGLIVTSLVGDIIMPIVGAIFGGFDFSNYFLPLSSTVTATSLEEARKQGAVFAYGNFLTVLINFLILAWIIFLMVRAVNNLRRRLEKEKPAPAAAPPPADVQLLTEIRDLLAKKIALAPSCSRESPEWRIGGTSAGSARTRPLRPPSAVNGERKTLHQPIALATSARSGYLASACNLEQPHEHP